MQKAKVPSKILSLLGNSELFELYTNELQKDIVGEEETIKAVFLCCCGRLVSNASMTSYNLLLNELSGAGKDFISSRVLNLIPREFVCKYTRISPKVLNYLHADEKDWTWNNKILYLEDVDNKILNSSVIKVMASSGSKFSVVFKGKAKELTVVGKPLMIFTSRSAEMNDEILRRFSVIDLDVSSNQTEKILQLQATLAVDTVVSVSIDVLVDAQHYLERVYVSVPYAEKLVKYFPADELIVRTIFPRFLDYIKASAAFHQFSREKRKYKSGVVIVANNDDYLIARRVFNKFYANNEVIPLSSADKLIRDKLLEFEASNKCSASATEIANHLKLTYQYICRRVEEMTKNGLLLRNSIKIFGVDKPVFQYQLIKKRKISLPERIE